jgi:hypothetical protein
MVALATICAVLVAKATIFATEKSANTLWRNLSGEEQCATVAIFRNRGERSLQLEVLHAGEKVQAGSSVGGG